MKILSLLFLIVLAGCGPGMGPKGLPLEEQIAKVKACREAGGRIIETRYEMNNTVGDVQCSFEPVRDPGKPCVDKGGVPTFSTWDGRLKDCKFPPIKEIQVEKWAYVFTCKNMPEAGQKDWVQWLEKNGECSQAFKERTK